LDVFISIPNQINSSIDSCSNYCFNTVTGLSKTLFKDAIKYDWCGIITAINFPDKSGLQPSLKVVEKLMPYITKIDAKGRELASLNFQIGFKESSYFKNITLSGYDCLQVRFPPNKKEISDRIEIDDTEISESGISILVDINNIPQNPKNSLEIDFSNVMEKNKSASISILDELNINEVINA
jgi:hypothetical protein